MKERQHGKAQPGIRWGPFTARLPVLHVGFALPEFAQGILLSAATGLALVPVMTGAFGLTFHEAVSMAFFHALLITSAPLLFGEPFATGWITPVLPFVLTLVLGERFPTPDEKFQAMIAMSLDLAIILLVLGVTGLGRRVIESIPRALKAAIIMGAAIAALKRVFLDDAPDDLYAMPISMTLAIGISLVLVFSVPMRRLKEKSTLVARFASLGLLPGLVIGGIAGVLTGELVYVVDGQSILQGGFVIPPVAALIEKASPFGVGFPSLSLMLDPDILSLAFIGYIILFGDMITGFAIIEGAQSARPDEKIEINVTRTHLSTGLRNAAMGLFVPFYPTQGILWTGVHVVIVNRWAEGRRAMDSLFTGIASYYMWGIPILYLFLPLVTALRPMLPIALALTLVLTGFACAYVAIDMVKGRTGRGTTVLGGAALALFDPWLGLLVAGLTVVLLTGWHGAETEE
ncbi:MAG: hypothetical protein ACC682_10475 [Gemmatimonadota bacterium]